MNFPSKQLWRALWRKKSNLPIIFMRCEDDWRYQKTLILNCVIFKFQTWKLRWPLVIEVIWRMRCSKQVYSQNNVVFGVFDWYNSNWFMQGNRLITRKNSFSYTIFQQREIMWYKVTCNWMYFGRYFWKAYVYMRLRTTPRDFDLHAVRPQYDENVIMHYV